MKFRTKFTLIVMAIVFALGGVISYISYAYNSEYLEEQAKTRLLSTTGHIIDNIDRLLFERSADISMIATDPEIRSRDSTPQEITKRLIEYRNICQYYASISFFDRNRVRVADTAGLDIGGQAREKMFWDEVLEGNVSKASYMEVSKVLGGPVFYFASPVKDKTGETFGYVVARMPAKKLYNEIKGAEGIYGDGKHLKVDLIKREGLLFYSNHNRKGMLDDNLSDEESVKRVLAGEKKGSGKHIRSMPAIQGAGEEELYAFVCERGYLDFKGNGWILIASVSARVALAPASELRKKILASVFVIAVLSALVILLFSFSVSRPIHALRKGVEIVGSGDLDYKVAITGRDEIAELSQTFDKMTDKLKKNETDRKCSEAALNTERSQLRTLIDNLPYNIYFKDTESRFVVANKTVAQNLGVTSPDELVGYDDAKFLPPDLARQYREDELRIMREGTGFCGKEEQAKIPDAEGLRWLSTTKMPIKNAAGDVIGLVGIGVDITERKAAEKALHDMAEAKTKFTSVVSHELRSPLATIKEATNLVLEGVFGPLNEGQADMLITAKNNIARLGRLVNNVLAYQKMEAKKIEHDFQMHDVNEVVKEAHINAMLFAGDRKSDIVMELGADLPRIKFDADKIMQVLINLLSNAIKYSESGPVVIQTRREDREILVSVRDSGHGIYPEDLDEIFKPFVQAKSKKKGGTGLGLAITKELVLAHHGRIWVESELGKGSIFYFTLPVT